MNHQQKVNIKLISFSPFTKDNNINFGEIKEYSGIS
jgi:hypothetical protein